MIELKQNKKDFESFIKQGFVLDSEYFNFNLKFLNKMSNENWVVEETPKTIRKKAVDVLNKLKTERKKHSYKYVKVSDKPLTYKEVRIN